MRIVAGLFDHMVLQRTARGVSDAVFNGTCNSAGAVIATVTHKGKAVRGFKAKRVGKAARGKFIARLAGLPVGGAYDVGLSIGDERLAVRDVLVGDVWLLGGQSNMEGYGLRAGLPKPDPMVRAFYTDDRWAVAHDPVHVLDKAVDRVHRVLGGGRDPRVGAGPGVSFARELHRLSGVPQGVIACAHGGTTLNQWNPAGKKLGSDSLYGAMMRRVKKNGGRVAGMAWYQGCSDTDEKNFPLYSAKMKKLVASLRRDCRDLQLPWVIVQIGQHVCNDQFVGWNAVQEQQRLLPKSILRFTVVPAVDLPLDDSIHLSGRGQWQLGIRMARAMWTLLRMPGAEPPPIELAGVKIRPDARDRCEIIATFRNVVGSLHAEGQAQGFGVYDSNGDPQHYRTDLAGKRAIVRTCFMLHQATDKRLYYGRGRYPFCNIFDEAGRPLPVFGPVLLAREKTVMTPFIQTVRISDQLPAPDKLKGLALPDSSAVAQVRTFPQYFLDRHQEIASVAGEHEKVVHYACRISCSEPMKLSANIGYDGPVRAWIDGQEKFHDPDGINPALPEDARVRFTASAGEHELIVALGTNKGKAWGIWLRFERYDIPRRLLAKGPGVYAMPQVTA